MKRCLLLAVALAVFPAIGSAQTSEARQADKTLRKQFIDFGEVTVEGEVAGPPDCVVPGLPRARFASLIKLRGSFVPEIQRSVDNL